jgi:hypothetical protein
MGQLGGIMRRSAQADLEEEQDPCSRLLTCYMTKLEREGPAAPLPLRELASLPQATRSEMTFTLRLMRACWGAGLDKLTEVDEGEQGRVAGRTTPRHL